MAMIGGFEDSPGGETYPRRRSPSIYGAGSPSPSATPSPSYPRQPSPRVTQLPGGGIMTTNDPTAGLTPSGGGPAEDAYGNPVSEKTPTYFKLGGGFDMNKFNLPQDQWSE